MADSISKSVPMIIWFVRTAPVLPFVSRGLDLSAFESVRMMVVSWCTSRRVLILKKSLNCDVVEDGLT